jgi:hypothetical protein
MHKAVLPPRRPASSHLKWIFLSSHLLSYPDRAAEHVALGSYMTPPGPACTPKREMFKTIRLENDRPFPALFASAIAITFLRNTTF